MAIWRVYAQHEYDFAVKFLSVHIPAQIFEYVKFLIGNCSAETDLAGFWLLFVD